jgi:hypothetical protein
LRRQNGENYSREHDNSHQDVLSIVCGTGCDLCYQRRRSRIREGLTDHYKKAFEAKDTTKLESILYTQGADAAIVGFYKMMQSGDAGAKISSIELVNLTPEDAKKAGTPMDSPTGGKVCLTLKPTKKLIIKIEKKDANGSSTSSSENFVAEKDGKFVIPVPGPCK